MFSLERINQIKDILEISIHNIIPYAQRVYPNECCGIILENGNIQPAHNVIEKLGDLSLTSKNAFLIDNESWLLALQRESPIIGIYHSHPNGDPNMSIADMSLLKWGELCYIVIGVVDTHPIAAKVFWWEDGVLKETNLKI